MMRSNSEAGYIKDPLIQGAKYTTLKQALTGTFTMRDAMPDLLALSAAAAQNVLLPLATAANEGRAFVIVNTSAGAFTLTVKDSTNTTTIGTVAQSKASKFVNIGGTWYAMSGA